VWPRRSTRSSIKDSFAKIARRLGFLTDEQAAEADQLTADLPSEPSQDLCVSAGFLTESQAFEVERVQQEEDPEGHLEQKLKKARSALEGAHASMKARCEATDPSALLPESGMETE